MPTPCERQTADSVAHDQRPQEGLEVFPAIGQKRLQDWCDTSGRILVQVIYELFDPNDVLPPPHLELNVIYSAGDAEDELRSWGFHYRVFLCGEHDIVFAHSLDAHAHAEEHTYVYCNSNTDAIEPVFKQHVKAALQEHQHMRFLYTKGYHKAVVLQQEPWMPQLTCIHFVDLRPEHEINHKDPRLRTPWPSAQPCQSTNHLMIDIEHLQQQDATRCQIEFDVKKLHEFFAAENMNILWKDYRQFELPDFIREALDQCRPVGRIDRYVIFTDGSSQTCLKHKPPVWIAENDVSDSWAFAVFAEQYGTQPGEASTLEFLGWSCQSVLYDSEAAHSIGTSRIGSDASETEALFWAGLWRLSCNNVVPTVFVSDSRLIGDQASGRCGSTIKDMPYYNLRAVFQTLHAGLPGQRLRVEHVRSHTGDPFNELVDWLAKREPRKSQYLPRQAINMQVFQPILRHLWMAAATTPDVPTLTSTGYSIPPIELPSQHLRSTPSILRTGKTLQFNISLGTANVRTFYRGEEGHPGKLQHIREQFQAHGLHFLGLQETRCDQGTSFQDQIFRIISGHEGGHLGVELWANLQQPYAHSGRNARYFKRSDFVVASQSARHLLVHVQNEDLDFWLLCAHAPHGGATGMPRKLVAPSVSIGT